MESLMPTKCLIEDLVCNKHLIKINCFQFPKYIHLNIYIFYHQKCSPNQRNIQFQSFHRIFTEEFSIHLFTVAGFEIAD